ncbi:MAG: ATP phosphoribosyltransferase [Acidimicrobiia bacterium]|nr:ATP phosphoribosyltransferase [Acidimicrobiia bacterium]
MNDPALSGAQLRLVVPKGSLEAQVLRLFEDADLPVQRSSDRDYRATIDDPRIAEVRILRPQEIGKYVEEGIFDIGITGRDWITETQAEVVSVCEIPFSKVSARPTRAVLAVPADSDIETAADLPEGAKISTELPEITRRFFADLGKKVRIYLSYGATEAKVPDIVDAIVDITETGSSLRRAGLRIVAELCQSYPELIANPEVWADPVKQRAIRDIQTLLEGAVNARGRVLVKLNCAAADLEGILEVLPSMKSPTVNELAHATGYAVETVVAKNEINTLIPVLKNSGAEDIIELPVTKIVE